MQLGLLWPLYLARPRLYPSLHRPISPVCTFTPNLIHFVRPGLRSGLRPGFRFVRLFVCPVPALIFLFVLVSAPVLVFVLVSVLGFRPYPVRCLGLRPSTRIVSFRLVSFRRRSKKGGDGELTWIWKPSPKLIFEQQK